jgi:Na+-driven multidrug efflux pump
MLCLAVLCRLQLGLQGAALAFTCSQGTTALLLVLYTIGREVRLAAAGDETATWCRPSMAVFAGGFWFLCETVGYVRWHVGYLPDTPDSNCVGLACV